MEHNIKVGDLFINGDIEHSGYYGKILRVNKITPHIFYTYVYFENADAHTFGRDREDFLTIMTPAHRLARIFYGNN